MQYAGGDALTVFLTEPGLIEVELQQRVVARMVMAQVDAEGQLFLTVVQVFNLELAAFQFDVGRKNLQRKADVEQLAPILLMQVQLAVEFGNGKTLVTIALAQLAADLPQ